MWILFQHPITRFFMRTFNTSHQELYERTMYHMYEETKRAKVTELEVKVRKLMQKRRDYQEYYFMEYNAEPVYENREFDEFYRLGLNEVDEATKQRIKAEIEGTDSKF